MPQNHYVHAISRVLCTALAGLLLAASTSTFAQPNSGRVINVPANSPLRSGIVVQPVRAELAVQRVELPATIETDPVLAEKIVPDSPGRVRTVAVAVGDHVRKGQLIAQFESLDGGDGVQPRIVNLISPATGTVTEMGATRGAFFDVPLQPLATIARFDSVRAILAVPEKYISFVRMGGPVQLSLLAYPGRAFSGKITAVGDLLDTDTRRLKVQVLLPNPASLLKPGMFGSAVLTTNAGRMPRIPASALVLDGASDAVFVEVSPWRFVKRRIQAGPQSGETVFVRSGLSDKDRIVTRGAVLLND